MTRNDPVRAIAALDDEVRRGLYEFVKREHRPVSRGEAASACRVSTKLAAFHLDKLVERGLLVAEHAVPEGLPRSVGRAPKRYSISRRELSLSLPERRYDLIGEILIDACLAAERDWPDEAPTAVARAVAVARGRALGAAKNEDLGLGRPGTERTIAAAEHLLDELGFETRLDLDGGLTLTNCPFRSLAKRAPELVCSINASFVDGILRGLGNDRVQAVLVPHDEHCCVEVRR